MELLLPKRITKNKLTLIITMTTLCLLISTVTLAKQFEMSDCNHKINTMGTVNQNVTRLDRNIKPIHYKLLLNPKILTKTYDGSITITFLVKQPTCVISLHSSKLTIKSANIRNNFNQTIFTNTSKIEDENELLHLYVQHETLLGEYKLDIDFSGRLDKSFVGLYASVLRNGGSMVASKFQPTYARQAFPCFDEPDFKATFDVSLVKPKTYIALSNMNEVMKKPIENTDLEVVTFATSVQMSTYLACFVICDFEFKQTEINSNGIGNNFELKAYGQKDQMHKIDFALDIGKRATEFYVNYYKTPFPLPKLDMIAIPDYVSGATEHWGLITYRETSFLVDEATASSRNKISVALTIAHELAHMWFGNLVTMKWWDEIWLNEGFASYMQVKALNAIEPSWTMLDQFLTKTLHSVLVTDAKLSSHPIVQTVTTPDQITAIFDAISYNKGSSILRMLEGFIGEENFRQGVSDYLKKHEFGNTVTSDLLASLQPYFLKDNPNLDLSHILDTWTQQMGYPLLTVSEDGPNSYKITQKRFLLDPNAVYDAKESQFNYRWFVPITYKTENGIPNSVLWFPDNVDNVTLTLATDDKWFKINNNQVGYYRVNYPTSVWNKLIEQLNSNSKQLSISDRSHLLDDSFALASAEVIPFDLALNLTTYLESEQDYVPWATASSIFAALGEKLRHSSSYEKLQIYMQNLLKSMYDKQTWEKTDLSVIQRLLRTQIITMASRSELPAAKDQVRSVFLKWLSSRVKRESFEIETDLRDVIYYYGMKTATQDEWDQLWDIYLKEDDAQEMTKLRRALAAPRDTNILRKYLNLAWDEKNIRSQDYLNVLQYISSNPSGTELVWEEVRTKWQQLVDRFTLNSRYLGNTIPAITSSFDTESKLKELEQFFAKYPEAGAGETARRRALENIAGNIRWLATHKINVENWLNNKIKKN